MKLTPSEQKCSSVDSANGPPTDGSEIRELFVFCHKIGTAFCSSQSLGELHL